MAFQKEGVKQAEIALQLGVTSRTMRAVDRGWNNPVFWPPQATSPRLIDPYKTYLLKRWHQGCRKGAQLEREVRANGPLEGNVNRLKLIKRSMYGRAEIDLLKPRVLYQNKQNQDRKNKRKNHQAQQVDRLKKLKSMKTFRAYG